MPPPTPAEALSVLTRHRAAGVEIRLGPTRGGLYRCEVREAGQEVWTSLHPAHPGFATPEEALGETDTRIVAWRAAREEAAAADIETFLGTGRLRQTTVDVDGQPELRWEAQRADGSWAEPQATPRAAVRSAKG